MHIHACCLGNFERDLVDARFWTFLDNVFLLIAFLNFAYLRFIWVNLSFAACSFHNMFLLMILGYLMFSIDNPVVLLVSCALPPTPFLMPSISTLISHCSVSVSWCCCFSIVLCRFLVYPK